MTRFARILKWRDHATALLAALATAHVLGLIDLAGWLPPGFRASRDPAGLIIGAAICGLVHAIVLAALYRRRLVKGPLYRCAESRPAQDFGKPYRPGTARLFDGWQYR